MPKIVALGGCALMVLALNCPASRAGKMRKATTEAQVEVLLKWYHDYSEQGKYEQAYRVAELAYELAPDDPETVVTLKLARRQRNATTVSANTDQHLFKILAKLDYIERRLYTLEAMKRRTAQFGTLYREPIGSPDRGE